MTPHLVSSCSRRTLLFALTLTFWGCNRQAPSVEFSQVPPAGPGDPLQLVKIQGRVHGNKSGQKIVLYAKSGFWWVQPLADQPFTSIKDGTWQNDTHPGAEYAALLVDASYQPAPKMQDLPGIGKGVVAVARRAGSGPAPELARRVIRFSGYDWEVRHEASERGGTLNPYDPDNVWTDGQGYLHLRTTKRSDGWAGAELQLTHSLGHGLYRFRVRDISNLDPATALTLYTRDELATDQYNREIDMEVSRWGDLSEANAQFVVPPFSEPANVFRFEAPGGPLDWSFRWQPGRVLFETSRATGMVARHEFTASVPSPGGESVRMNLYVYGNSRLPARNASEVVIEKFEYLP